jgi:uncharacterized protein (TIGR03067 family)
MTPALLVKSREEKSQTAKQQLQGTWVYVSGRWPAQLFFAGDHFTVHFENRGTYMGTFQVDPTQSPAAMDMMIEEGPEPHKGQTALCIYSLDGDWLWWCPAEPGEKERRATFPLHGEGRYPTLVFRREVAEPPLANDEPAP